MNRSLTPLQADIIRLAQTRNLAKMTFREIARYTNNAHPYSVQVAVNKLLRDGQLTQNKKTGAILAASLQPRKANEPVLLHIPIMGRVSCGDATQLAENEPIGYVAISPSVAHIRDASKTYALIATGDSMCKAQINRKTVNDGDYVVVQKSDWGIARDGEYIVSRFNEMNNLKRFRVDKLNHRYLLLSESHELHPPIIIAEEDLQYYAIEGIAVDVIKGVGI